MKLFFKTSDTIENSSLDILRKVMENVIKYASTQRSVKMKTFKFRPKITMYYSNVEIVPMSKFCVISEI